MRTVRSEFHQTGGRVTKLRERELDVTITVGPDKPGDPYRRRSASACLRDNTRSTRKQCGAGYGPDSRTAVANALNALAERLTTRY